MAGPIGIHSAGDSEDKLSAARTVKTAPGVLVKVNCIKPSGSLVGLFKTSGAGAGGMMSRDCETLGMPLTNIVACTYPLGNFGSGRERKRFVCQFEVDKLITWPLPTLRN